MTERCRPLVHPTTGQRLQAADAVQLPGDLPNNLFLVRVEGLTLRSSSYEMPNQLAMMASYANLPMVRVGPMRTRRLPSDGDDFGTSFTVTSTEHTDDTSGAVSYTHLRAHETPEHLVCRLLLEKKKKNKKNIIKHRYMYMTAIRYNNTNIR
eukprot:TRINITY_DN43204_c0_g1_i3.p1 TRINITY_DN43204_c0_g1~~TRINITY_DN43204_c0_g1_i3.p1  ORF type:complete len:152 (+),score=25.41 TRINITY_DN43204_c0_g1_i3:306-761(+)